MPEHTPLIDSHAVLGDGPDHASPLHYGAPLREQRALLDGRAFVDLPQFEVLEVTGPDREQWLTTVTSQVFTGRREGDSFEATVLSPQGRVEHWAQVVAGADSFLFILDAGARAGLRDYFTLMTFANRIELRDRDDLRVLGSTVPLENIPGLGHDRAPRAIAAWKQDWPAVAQGGLAYGPDPDFTEPWFLTLVSDDEAHQAVASGAITPSMLAGMSGAEAIRIANHRPRFARDVDPKTIPHELDLLRTAVHTHKGCYRGQETVAKVMNLGQPPRRLTMLHLDGSQDLPVPVGAAVKLDAKQVGQVTSSALHADLGPIALAVIKRAVPLDAQLMATFDAGGDAQTEMAIDASQEPIVVARDHGARPETASLGTRVPTARLG